LETGRVQQVILEQLAGPFGFVEHLQKKIGMRPSASWISRSCSSPGSLTMSPGLAAAATSAIRMPRRWLLRSSAITAQDCWNRECQHGAEPDKPCSIYCAIYRLSLHDPSFRFGGGLGTRTAKAAAKRIPTSWSQGLGSFDVYSKEPFRGGYSRAVKCRSCRPDTDKLVGSGA
jgi:hypothetical protein